MDPIQAGTQAAKDTFDASRKEAIEEETRQTVANTQLAKD